MKYDNLLFQLNDRFRLRQENFGGLLFDPKYWRIYQINKISYDVLTFCQKKKKIGEIIDFISNERNLNISIKEVSNFLDQLITQEVLEKYES